MIELRWVRRQEKPDALAIAAGYGASRKQREIVLQYRELPDEFDEQPVWVDVPVVEET